MAEDEYFLCDHVSKHCISSFTMEFWHLDGYQLISFLSFKFFYSKKLINLFIQNKSENAKNLCKCTMSFGV